MAASAGDEVDAPALDEVDAMLQRITDMVSKGRSVLLHGPGGTGKCLHPDTLIVMEGWSRIRAADILPGDRIIGYEESSRGMPTCEGSVIRTVLSTCSGKAEMYKIEPINSSGKATSESFIVNDVHVLTLREICGSEKCCFSSEGTNADKVSADGCDACRTVDIPLNELLKEYSADGISKKFRMIRSGNGRARVANADGILPPIHPQFTVESIGVGDYAGFTLDGDGRFVLDAGRFVTHNTHTLRALSTRLVAMDIPFSATAFTGVAAMHLTQADAHIFGSTLNSWAGIGLGEGSVDTLCGNLRKYPQAAERIRGTQVLIIDEVSMIGSNLFSKIDGVCRRIRKNDLPLGGIAAVLSGDFLQLPPIQDGWIFEAEEWSELRVTPILFETSHRFTDATYFDFLQRARVGDLTREDRSRLRARRRAYGNLMKVLGETTEIAIKPTFLYPRRADVDSFNARELAAIDHDTITFSATDTFTSKTTAEVTSLEKGLGAAARRSRRFPRGGQEPTVDFVRAALDNQASDVVELKIGAQVMLTKNLDIRAGLVNGTRGVVTGVLDDGGVSVRVLSGATVDIARYGHTYNLENGVASRSQIPLILAWASTIHKSQGATIDFLACDLGSKIFQPAQAYVALSRARNFQGLFISNLDVKKVYANGAALVYCEEMQTIADAGLELVDDAGAVAASSNAGAEDTGAEDSDAPGDAVDKGEPSSDEPVVFSSER